MSLDLVPSWAGILALAVFMYVLLDGFDLGVGILSAFAPDEASRDLMMDSVAPIWDGNETWHSGVSRSIPRFRSRSRSSFRRCTFLS